MKKFTIALLIICCLLLLSACQGDKSDDDMQSTAAEESNEETDDDLESSTDTEDTSSLLNEEDYTSEIVEPTFAVPLYFSDCTSYVEYPEYDSTETTDEGTDQYFDNNILVMERTYTETGNIYEETIYESDGTTTSVHTSFEYDSEISFSVEYYSDGSVYNRYKFTFDDDELLLYVYHMYYDENSSDETSSMEMYEYNPDGTIKLYIDTDNFSQLMTDVIMSAFSGALE